MKLQNNWGSNMIDQARESLRWLESLDLDQASQNGMYSREFTKDLGEQLQHLTEKYELDAKLHKDYLRLASWLQAEVLKTSFGFYKERKFLLPEETGEVVDPHCVSFTVWVELKKALTLLIAKHDMGQATRVYIDKLSAVLPVYATD